MMDFVFFMLFFIVVLIVFVREFFHAKEWYDGDEYFIFRGISAFIVVADLWILVSMVRDIVVYFGAK